MIQLVYNDTPPSLNRIGTRGSRWAVTRAKARWQGILEQLLLISGLRRGQARIHATASLRLPLRRTRDEGNYRWCLEKALGDALVNGRWLPDDTPEHFTFGELTFEQPGPGRTTVTLQINGEEASSGIS
jgi:hypothetical protein